MTQGREKFLSSENQINQVPGMHQGLSENKIKQEDRRLPPGSVTQRSVQDSTEAFFFSSHLLKLYLKPNTNERSSSSFSRPCLSSPPLGNFRCKHKCQYYYVPCHPAFAVGLLQQTVTKASRKKVLTDPENKTDNPAVALRERGSSTTLKRRVGLSCPLKFTC